MITAERLAMERGAPCYLSFETALAYHDVIDDCIYKTSCATLRDDFELKTELGILEFVRIDEDNFFGYNKVKDALGKEILMAEPEKALLDWIWLCEDRGYQIQLDEINWKNLSRAKLDEYSERMRLNYKEYMPSPGKLRRFAHPKYKLIARELEGWLST